LMKSSRSLLGVDEEATGSLELARWLLKPPKTVGDADPGAEDEGCSLVEHSDGEVEGCHRILRWMLDEHPYLVRQLSVFYHHALRGIPLRW
jgi:hypothetical protein